MHPTVFLRACFRKFIACVYVCRFISLKIYIDGIGRCCPIDGLHWLSSILSVLIILSWTYLTKLTTRPFAVVHFELKHQSSFINSFLLMNFSELYYDRGNHHEFTSLVKELARQGELTQNTSYNFEFAQVEKPYESYTGANVRLR